jgi:hypothetical protein
MEKIWHRVLFSVLVILQTALVYEAKSQEVCRQPRQQNNMATDVFTGRPINLWANINDETSVGIVQKKELFIVSTSCMPCRRQLRQLLDAIRGGRLQPENVLVVSLEQRPQALARDYGFLRGHLPLYTMQHPGTCIIDSAKATPRRTSVTITEDSLLFEAWRVGYASF